jgi:prepilin-type N-terminal cleavage/methylation domain-containing protein
MDAMFKVRMRKLFKSGVMHDQKGFSLVEELVAIVLLTIIAAAIFTALQTMILTFGQMNTQEMSKDIASSDMDYIMSQTYGTNYTLPQVPAEYSGYTSSLSVTQIQSTEQQILISISFKNKVRYTLTDYRTYY